MHPLLLKTLQVVDFVGKRIGLVVAIDGYTHSADAGIAHDARRADDLAGLGSTVLRFDNGDVLNRAEGVFEVLRKILGDPVA